MSDGGAGTVKSDSSVCSENSSSGRAERSALCDRAANTLSTVLPWQMEGKMLRSSARSVSARVHLDESEEDDEAAAAGATITAVRMCKKRCVTVHEHKCDR